MPTTEFHSSNRSTWEIAPDIRIDHLHVTYRLVPELEIDGILYGMVDVARGISGPEGNYEFVDIFAIDRKETRNNPISYNVGPKRGEMKAWDDAPDWIKDLRDDAYRRVGANL